MALKNFFIGILSTVLFSPLFWSCSESSKQIEFYVSVDGSNHNPGTRSAPVASFEKAKEIVRAKLKEKPNKPIVVYFGGGVYQTEKSVVFTSEDSGTETAPVTYTAAKGEKAVFTGSKRLQGWNILKDEPALAQLTSSVRGKVYVTNLGDAGITNLGDPIAEGIRPELFCNGSLQTLARWPNEGFIVGGKAKGKTVLPPTYIKERRGTREGIFDYKDKRLNRWTKEKEVCFGGYWFWDWSEEYQKADKIDTITRTMYIREPYHNYGYRDSLKFFGLNLFCEIDQPSEWYLDRDTKLLYWYPPEGINPETAEVRFTVFNESYMIEMKDCSYVTLRGLEFEEGRGNAILIMGGKGCRIKECRVERFGRDGIHIYDGSDHGVSGCLLRTLGYGGFKISGGDRKTLTPGNHFVEHTIVEQFSLFKRTYEPAVHLAGCGNRLSNNRFRYSSSSAMRLEGNDFLIEYNEIDHVVNESDDQGGLDIFYNPSYRGIVVQYNHWADIYGGTRHGAAGVRLDDMISGMYIYGNIFERCGSHDFGAIQIHGGKENKIDNNLFYKCPSAVSFEGYGKKWFEAMDRPEVQKKLYEEVDIDSPTYLEKYPDLKNIRTNIDINSAADNLVVGCEKTFTRMVDLQILSNNTSIPDNGKDLLYFCAPEVLEKYGLKPIPYQKIGPKLNPWLNK